jgi:hypothetical protein
MLIGSVLTVVFSALALIGASVGCLLLALLFFDEKSSIASGKASAKPGKTLMSGFFWLIGLGLLSALLIQAPATPAKIAGFLLLAGMLAISAIGTAGLVGFAAERITKKGGADNDFQAQLKASILLVLACLFPVLGGFMVAPAVVCIGLSSGIHSLRKQNKAPASPQQEAA